MKKLWGGRFQSQGNAATNAFGASISFDYKLAEEDIKGSIAHVTMLATCGIVSESEKEDIIAGLQRIEEKIKAQTFEFSLAQEDIHLNIEQALHEEIGPVAGKLHTARSRNDQVATDMHLYLKKEVLAIIDKLVHLQTTLVKKADKHVDTLMPGYTHLQHAQPISFAHHLLAYYNMFKRDYERLQESIKRIDISPLGCAALAGTTFPIDRELTADLLGFSHLYSNSMDGVSDRDFIVEFLSNSSLIMVHLSRLCEELILWSSFEYQFIEMDDAYATGSSIMPQKKNPDYAELIRGKSGRVFGHLFGLLTVLKGTPLAYNKDLQEDKEGMFDTVQTISMSLEIMAGMIETMTVKKDKMAQSTETDFSNATELADYLVTKGIPFREAHEIVGKLVYDCLQKEIFLQDIPLSAYQEIAETIDNSVYNVLEARTAMNRRNSFGGTGSEQVRKAVQVAKKDLRLED
ncbi:argininosuccinate lyase [Vagococcus sp. DIV0080]|uniref:Argininosuccinate lyase n=1 Tax=Candidatus Vagococcus giribetii TaxID=2230876 RepID=A0ABS3HPR3_9ENTE|nr:argininosuccinate lyase [Vagococcus sp. DIV0080]MBO0475739.1 argininosuccinate lyase [Vagococcus sp. DIV0080]